MSALDFLVELGTEELPPKALANAPGREANTRIVGKSTSGSGATGSSP